jgi:hypothetical protein
MFDISADRLGNNGNPGKSVHVKRFSQRADAAKYLDEPIARFKGNCSRDEQEERWWIREAGGGATFALRTFRHR